MTVVARHIGRLSNNQFQIACAIGYARKYGYEWGVDPSHGHGEPYSAIHKVFPNLPKQAFGGGVRYHEHPHGICKQHGRHYDLCHFNYHDIPDLGPNVSLTGFFQSWKYFEHCKEEVKEVFKLVRNNNFKDHVSLHVRRGDYVQHSGSFPPITTDYIDRAIIALKKNGVDVRNIICFSDDIKWCEENIPSIGNITVKYCYEEDEYQALSTMASCGNHIIANSSFSWWSAYLGQYEDRQVVCPSAETWFGPTAGVKEPVVDLILPEWIQIPTR